MTKKKDEDDGWDKLNTFRRNVQNIAIIVVSITAIIGFVGNYFYGKLDKKYPTIERMDTADAERLQILGELEYLEEEMDRLTGDVKTHVSKRRH